MSMPSPNPSGGPRMSRSIKLVLMGVAGAALLYSCAPTMMGGGGFLWLLPWLFRGGPGMTSAPPPGQSATTTTRQSPAHTDAAPSHSQRGGFGSTGSSGSSSGSS